MTPEQERADIQAKINHSGNAPEDIRELPEREFDKTLLADAVEAGYIQTPEDVSALVEHHDQNEKHGFRAFIAKPLGKVTVGVAGLLTAGAATFGVIAATNHGPEKTEPVAEAPANPGEEPAQNPGSNEQAPNPNTVPGSDTNEQAPANNGEVVDRIDPESLKDISQEQITELVTIPAVDANGNSTTPEEYAKELTRNLDAWFNSGMTESELKPYVNTPKGQYEGAIQAKYDNAFISGMFTTGLDPTGWRDSRSDLLFLANSAYAVNGKLYEYHWDYKSELVTEPQTSPEDDFTLKIDMHSKDNMTETGLVELFGDMDGYQPTDNFITYSVHVINEAGNLKVASIDRVDN